MRYFCPRCESHLEEFELNKGRCPFCLPKETKLLIKEK